MTKSSARKNTAISFLIILGSLILSYFVHLVLSEIITKQQQEYLDGVTRRIAPTLYTYDLYTMNYLLEEVLYQADVQKITVVDQIANQKLLQLNDEGEIGAFHRPYSISSPILYNETTLGTIDITFINRSVVFGIGSWILLSLAGSFVFVLFVADKQKKQAEIVKQQLDELQHTYQLTKLIVRLSHEFGSPLGNIQLATSCLIDSSTKGSLTKSELAESLSLVQENTNTLIVILEKLRTINLIDSELMPISIELEPFLRDSYSMVSGTKSVDPATITIQCKNNPIIHSYPQILQEVLKELISNALAYNDSASPEMQICGKVVDTRFTITVKDNGVGLSQTLIPQLFQLPIHGELSAKPRYGLFIASKLCKKYLQGSLEFERRGQWNCFFIRGTESESRGNH